MIYVISTLSNDNEYVVYENRDDISIPRKRILIKGGANIQDRKTLQLSSQGVTTPISEADYEDLKKNPVFNLHLERGFIKIVQTNESDAKKKAEKMNTKDRSAQLTPKDYEERGFKKAPQTDLDKIETSK